MITLIHPVCFPNVAHFVAMVKADKIIFEFCDNYQKQTYRNRASIYGANGKLDLNIPVIYSQKNRQLYSEVQVFNSQNWQLQLLKSLESAYRMSPFYEFYIDDLMPLFEIKTTTIMDFNMKCLDTIFECLQLSFNFSKTSRFEIEPKGVFDARSLVNSRKEKPQNFKTYAQVFDNKHDFISNLSILDLLFNEGPNTELYLKSQQIQL